LDQSAAERVQTVDHRRRSGKIGHAVTDAVRQAAAWYRTVSAQRDRDRQTSFETRSHRRCQANRGAGASEDPNDRERFRRHDPSRLCPSLACGNSADPVLFT
jgi:hypothetical protein